MRKSNNSILRKYIKSTEFEIYKIPYLMHRLPEDNVSKPMVDNIKVTFFKKNIQPRYILTLPLYLFFGGDFHRYVKILTVHMPVQI